MDSVGQKGMLLDCKNHSLLVVPSSTHTEAFDASLLIPQFFLLNYTHFLVHHLLMLSLFSSFPSPVFYFLLPTPSKVIPSKGQVYSLVQGFYLESLFHLTCSALVTVSLRDGLLKKWLQFSTPP